MSCNHRNKQQTSIIVQEPSIILNESANSTKEKTTEMSWAKIVKSIDSTARETKLVAAKPQVNQK